MAERSWREAHTTGAAAQSEEGVAPTSVPEVEFSIMYVRSTAEAAKAIQGALLQLRCDVMSASELTHPAPGREETCQGSFTC